MKLFNIIKSTAKKMMIDFEEITSQLEHRGLKGKGREGIVGQFLSSYLPTSYEFINGTIISASGVQSKEQDIIIADNSSLVRFLDSQSVAVVPVESVLATIEIKSNLTSEELSNSIENVHSVRSLAKHYFGNTTNVLSPRSFIFAFRSSITIEKALEVLRSKRAIIPMSHFPSAVIFLNRGSLLLLKKSNLNHITLVSDESVTWGIKHTADPADNLMMLYLLVATALFSSRPGQDFPDLLTYAQKSGFILPETKVSASDAEDTYCSINGKEISSNAVMRSTELIKKLFENEIKDNEIIELFHFISQNPYSESFRSESVYFVENERRIIPWPAKEVTDAIIRHRGGGSEDRDKEIIDTFCRVIREAVDLEKYVEIGDLEMDARHGKKYIRTKGYKPKW